ncbi:MAG: hypothetical protein DWQ10_02985 [Calditrichaeota bacterium]|nr:MAG: hypothetical protein DWQ10_02985 [Calditrichota bacterium]
MYSSQEIERIIQSITDRVVANIMQQLSPATSNADSTNENSFIWQKKLITEQNAIAFYRQGISRVVIAPNTLITPLARDYLAMKKIIFEKKVSIEQATKVNGTQKATKAIGLICGSCSQTAVNTIRSVMTANGYQVQEFKPRRGFVSELRKSTKQLSEQIRNNDFVAGVVIDEAAFLLKKQAEKYEGISAAMCWDISCAAANGIPEKANMVFINNRLLGFKKLEKLMRIWALNLN